MKLRSRTISAIGAIVALASAGGLVALSAPSDARAAGETDSAVTVKWAGGNGDLQQFQPPRDDVAPGGRYEDSGFWEDFKDLQVTVSQTKGLTDQGITLTASGMERSVRESFLPGSQNFLQVMQCWGDPEEPDFASTCQWGALSGFETAKSTDAATTGAFGDGGFADATLNRGEGAGRAPFRSVTGQVQEPETITLPGESGSTVTTQGLDRFFSASTTNELVRVPFGSDRTATATFIAQSAAAQPYLGCGDPESQAGERCWLVIVPRGSHSTNLPDTGQCAPREAAAYGEAGYNLSSPIASTCGAWSNRIVIPLDFSNPFVSCPAGTAERRIVGSELLADAMSSWQPVLCDGDDGATFSLTTNAGDLVRSQLLTGAAGMAVVAEPLTESTIATADPALLEEADLRYGPVANSAVTIGFLLEERDGRTARDLKLTPRLVAKLLTQTYAADRAGDLAGVDVGDITADEEWKALGNPTNLNPSVVNGAWVVVGPQGDDAFRSLWEYVLADADAVAFLKGSPDPWGTTVNQFYLPPEHSDALGGGIDLLSSPIDVFPRQDQSRYPANPADPELEVLFPNYRGQVLDSTAMFPYSTSLTANAERIARADSRYTRSWDPNKLVGVASIGDFVPADPALPGRLPGRLVFGPTSAPAAEQYGLTTASLAQPLASATTEQTVVTAREFVPYDDESVAAGIAAHTADADTGLGTADLSKLPDGAYPLATTLYAAANLNAIDLDREARREYAHFVTYAATDGNVRSGDRGGLPEGYVPLTAQQQEAALDLAERLTTEPGRGPEPSGDAEPDGADGSGGRADGADGDGPGGPDDPADTSATVPVPDGGDGPAADGPPSGTEAAGGAGGDPTTTQNEAAATEDTAPLAASVALGGTLVAGLAGMVGAPFLMRRRDLTG